MIRKSLTSGGHCFIGERMAAHIRKISKKKMETEAPIQGSFSTATRPLVVCTAEL
jgi:hypothetical protein